MNDEIKRLLYFLWTNRFKIYSYNYEPTMDHREFMMSMVKHFYNSLTNTNRSFVVIYYEGTKRKTKSILDGDLKIMYKPLFERRRSIYKGRHTRRSPPRLPPRIPQIRGRSSQKTRKNTRRSPPMLPQSKSSKKTRKNKNSM